MLRPAKIEDHAFLTEFLFQDFSQRHAILPVSHEAISKVVLEAINDGRCAVYERDGKIVGSTAIRSGGAWYSEDRAAFDIWIAAQGQPVAAGRLRQWLCKKAASYGCRLFIGVSGNNDESNAAARNLGKRHPLISRTFEASMSV